MTPQRGHRRSRSGSFGSFAMAAMMAAAKLQVNALPVISGTPSVEMTGAAICTNDDAPLAALKAHTGEARSFCNGYFPDVQATVTKNVVSTVTSAATTSTVTVTAQPTITFMVEQDFLVTVTTTEACTSTSIAVATQESVPAREAAADIPPTTAVRHDQREVPAPVSYTTLPSYMSEYSPAEVSRACDCFGMGQTRTVTSVIATTTIPVQIMKQIYTKMAGTPVVVSKGIGETRTLTQTVCAV